MNVSEGCSKLQEKETQIETQIMKHKTRYEREDPKEIKKCYRKTCPTCGRGRWVGYHAMITDATNCQPCCRMIKAAENHKLIPHIKKDCSYKKVMCSRCRKTYTVEKNNLYAYMKKNKLKKYICQKCKFSQIKENADEERKKEVEFLETLTVAKTPDPIMLNKNKKFIPRKLDYNGCAWEEEPFIGGIISDAKRCKNWTACGKRRECSSKLCKIGWKSFTSDCKGFVKKSLKTI